MLTREEATAILLEERLFIIAFIGVIVRNYHLAEDIFQELCVKTLVHAETFESRVHLLKWAKLSGKGRALNVLRSRNGRFEDLNGKLLDDLADVWPESRSSHASDPCDLLNQCLQELTDHNQEIVRLRYFEGRSGGDIAEKLERKLSSVHQALARIHKMLGECIRRRTMPRKETS